HLSMELLKSMVKIDLVHVPYKSAGIAITDLLAGQVQAQFISYGTGVGHFKAGRLRALAATTTQRSKVMPDVPTIAEAGVPGYEAVNWWGMVAPAGTPQAIIDKVHKALGAVQTSPEVQKQFSSEGAEIVQMSPSEFAAYLQKEIVRWERVVKEGNIKAE
ncbi:MAG: tripartite tricarboxylate transporter substrate-binding protein, partial [Xanthobacteraceae bacterium]